MFCIGDPSLASALSNRYNGGSLVQHQAAIYDANTIPTSGSPVQQVYTTACKPEATYWHQAPDYNVNSVLFFVSFRFRHFSARELQRNFRLFVTGFRPSYRSGESWHSVRRICDKRCPMAISIARNIRHNERWRTGMCELLNIAVNILASG